MNCFKAEKNGPNCEVFHRFGLTLFLMPAVAAVEAEGAAAAAVADVVGVVGVGLAALAASNLCCIVRTCDAVFFADAPVDGLVVGLFSLVAFVDGVFGFVATPPAPTALVTPLVVLPVLFALVSLLPPRNVDITGLVMDGVDDVEGVAVEISFTTDC